MRFLLFLAFLVNWEIGKKSDSLSQSLGALHVNSARAVELEKLSLKYRHFHESNRMPELPGFKAKEGLTLNVDLSLVGPLFWNNRVIALTDSGSYRYIAWEFEFGVTFFCSFRGFYEHKSQHLLDHTDAVYPHGRFPVSDALAFEWVWAGSMPECKRALIPK